MVVARRQLHLHNIWSRNIFPFSMENCALYAPLWQEDMRGAGPIRSYDKLAHSMTITGTTWGSTGRTFDGSDDFISIADHADFDTGGVTNVLVWFKNNAQASKRVIARYDWGLAARSWDIYTLASQKWGVTVSDDGTLDVGHSKQYVSIVTACDNTFHLAAFTFSSGTLKLYVDGAEDTNPTKTADDAITSVYSSAVTPTLGAYLNNGAAEANMAGDIGEAWIYRGRALTAAEINRLYEITRGRYL